MIDMDETWFYYKDGKKYHEWRNGARIQLESIVKNIENWQGTNNPKEKYNSHEKHLKLQRERIKTFFSWIFSGKYE